MSNENKKSSDCKRKPSSSSLDSPIAEGKNIDFLLPKFLMNDNPINENDYFEDSDHADYLTRTTFPNDFEEGISDTLGTSPNINSINSDLLGKDNQYQHIYVKKHNTQDFKPTYGVQNPYVSEFSNSNKKNNWNDNTCKITI